MATTTSKLGLTKPAYTDAADVGVLNNNYDILDREVSKRTRVWNLLDNSNFRNPVNQRGQTTITQNFQYFIDRWQTNNVDAARPVSITASGLKLDGSNGSATTSIFQPVSNLRDGVYTSAAKAGNSVWIVQFTLTNGVYAKTNGYNDGKGQIYISGNGEKLNINLQGFAGYSVTFEWAALYEGTYTAETLPEYIPLPKKMEMIRCGVPLQPVNLLDNSDFRNGYFIAQAGLNGTHGTTIYLGDRWTGDARITAAQHAGFLRLTSTAQYAFVRQQVPIEGGKTYTFAVRSTGNNSYLSFDVPNGGTVTAKERIHVNDIYILRVNTSSDCAMMGVSIYPGFASGGGSADIYWAALYEGTYTAETLPEYQPKGYAAELAECQRYCLPMRYGVISGIALGTNAQLIIPTPVTMRIEAPTFFTTDAVWVYGADGTTALFTSTRTVNTGYGVRLDGTLNANLGNKPCVAPDFGGYLLADL